jgi:ribosome biogenesis GTPase A
MGYWGVVLNVLKNADVVVLVCDARVPEMTRNKEVIRRAEVMNKRVLLVFNKADLIGESDSEYILKKYKGSFLTSEKDKTSVNRLRDFLIEIADKHERESLRVAIVGYPNVGKSSLINILIPGARAEVSKKSGTTKKTEWLRYKNLRLMDSPGVIPARDSNEVIGIVAAKDARDVKNPEKIAVRVIGFLRKKNPEIIKNFYNATGEDDYEIFLEIGKQKNYLIKGGEIDEHRTAIKIIEDWQQGKIPFK